ncbi:MAG: PilW family protein [Magnetococcales bacterium]|nr:PilW family protein [Magnetococcales bacterium]
MIASGPHAPPERERGYSLLEILIALGIGLLVITGMLKILSGTNQTYRLNSNLSRIQENARFAIELLTRESRMAGYWGCTSDVAPHNALVTPNSYSWAFNDRIRGFDNSDHASWPATFQSAALPGTDALVISGIDATAHTVEYHLPCDSRFKIAQSHDLASNEVAFVTDCVQGAIFQITAASTSDRTLTHDSGTGTIGNSTPCLDGNCGGACATSWYAYPPGSLLARIRAMAFFIGTGANGEPALFWELLNRGATTTRAELVNGVENLQILYGRDTDADRVANQYLTASAVEAAGAWGEIVQLRIALLLRSVDNVRSAPDTNTYTLAETPVAATGTTVTHPADYRLRKMATTTIQLRN